MARPDLRPGVAILLIVGVVSALVYTAAVPLFERATVAMERRQARAAQLAMARAAAAQREELERRVSFLQHRVDEGALFNHGASADMVQGSVQGTIRAAAQSGGLAIRALDSRTETIGGTHYRLTTHVSASGGFEAINAALAQLEAARPLLLPRDVRIKAATTGPSDGPPVLSVDLDIDAYADLVTP
ncbi:type II secretion system protein GspM [Nitrospirillum iridis]|uniref:General secretion pathway protein GspM n=1 Tax=Nitrospirillum iridis TaxID=765888 RepID=A0A7X0B082_9PROT|nr:type II secretion system protein GspM [Nitrospirillum iridis]MBB6253387.1 hypothetical protein [Nitrospirillum iridis]